MNQKKEPFSIPAEFRENICNHQLTGLEKLSLLLNFSCPAPQGFSELEMA